MSTEHKRHQPSEPDWEYGVRHVDVDGWPRLEQHESRKNAADDYATCGMNCTLMRRLNAGPGEAVSDA